MKNIKNFAIYGLSVGSLSNICAMDFEDEDDNEDFDFNKGYNDEDNEKDNNGGNNDNENANDFLGNLAKFAKNPNNGNLGNVMNAGLGLLGIDENLKNSLKGLTDAILVKDKKKALEFLNKTIFNKPENIKDLEVHDNIHFVYSKKEEEKNQETVFVLFHGLGQPLYQYGYDIENLQNIFNADVLLIEYNMNGEKPNTFEDMEGYCEEVAQFIGSKNYKNNIFFGYSLGSFVGNLVREHFNGINGKNLRDKQITSKYIGYKGIFDLDNAGSSFIKTLTGGYVKEELLFATLNILLVGKNIASYSDVFKYLLGEEEFNKIKALTNNSSILQKTYGFSKDKVVFDEKLKSKGHDIDLASDIEVILNVFNDNKNKGKDVFLFQATGGDNVVGTGMQDTYDVIIDKKPVSKGKEKDNKDNQRKDISKPEGQSNTTTSPTKQNNTENTQGIGICCF